jgi:hypothetical protein
MRIPNFFIAGAPKCGTTSLYRYLQQHPEIFMPRIKEPHFFGTDLQSSKYIRDEQEYLSLFSSRRGERFVGEASAYYLYSERAAAEIKNYNPSSSIIIMLRNPVDMVYSLHSQAVSSGNEDIVDFADALKAEDDRRQGRRIPGIADFPRGLLYRDIAKYSQQVRRYLDLFGTHQVQIILFDDFVRCPDKIFRETLGFLGVDNKGFQATFEKVNENRRLRSITLEHLLKKRRGLRNAIKRTAPAMYSFMYSTFHRLNAVKSRRQAMDPELRASLCEEFTPDVQELSQITGRDLSAWMSPMDVKASLSEN